MAKKDDELFATNDPDIVIVEKKNTERYIAKSLSEFNICKEVGNPLENYVILLVDEITYYGLINHCMEDAICERGGFLLGTVFQDLSGKYIVKVSGYIHLDSEKSTALSLLFSYDSWYKASKKILDDDSGRILVGWYHTHIFTILKLSHDDITLHKGFFQKVWHVAMVVNEHGDIAFNNWSDSKIVQSSGYYVVKD